MTDHFPPALLHSPAFLLVALVAGRATRDQPLELLAAGRLADLGIRVAFDADTFSRRNERREVAGAH